MRRSRSTIPSRDGELRARPDPILDGVSRAYGGAFVGYARDELGFKTEMTYDLLASEISGKWDWQAAGTHAAERATICASCSPSPRRSSW